MSKESLALYKQWTSEYERRRLVDALKLAEQTLASRGIELKEITRALALVAHNDLEAP